MQRIACLTLIATLAGTDGIAGAQTTPVVYYHAFVTNTRNDPVTGSFQMKFTLYDAQTAGNVRWMEQSTVLIDNGNAAIPLGTMTPLTADLFEAGSLYLEVKIGNDVLPTRQPVGSVPSAITALEAQNALRLGGKPVVVTGCAGGQVLTYSDSGWSCSTVTGGGGQSFTTSPELQLDAGVLSLTSACAAGQVLKFNGNAWACDSAGATYTAGNGIQITAGAISLSSAGCALGQVQKWNGTSFACDNDLVGPTYTGGSGIQVNGTVISLTPGTCNANQVLKYSGTAWGCGDLTANGVLPDAGLQLTAGSFGLATCGDGQILKFSATAGGWACQTDQVGPAYTNGAGLALNAGTFSIAPGGVTFANLAQNGCGSNQVPKWNGSAWVCADLTAYGVSADAGVQLSGSNFGLMPCTDGQFMKYVAGQGWTCGAVTGSSGGTVTQVSTGVGLTGGPITASGTVSMLSCTGTQVLRWNGSNWACSSAAGAGANSDITSLSGLSTPLSIAQGGTGSASQNFIDLTTNQTAAGQKTFAPTTDVSAIVARQSTIASPTADILAVKSADGGTTFFNVDSTGAVNWTGTANGNISGSAGSINGSSVTGIVAVSHGGTGADLSTTGAANYYVKQTGTGAALSVGPLSADEVTAGTLTVSHGGTGQTAALTTGGVVYSSSATAMASTAAGASTQVLHGGAAPSWSAVSLSSDVTGTLAVTSGGTGQTAALTAGGVVYSSSTTAMASTPVGTAGQVLHSNAAAAPTWGSVALGSDVSGTLPVTRGGTGATSLTTNGVLYGGASVTATAAPGAGQLLVGNASGVPTFVTMSGDATLASDGGITLASVVAAGTSTKVTYNAKGLVTLGASATLASTDFANQGTATTLLHGGGAGGPTWSAVSLTTDVTNTLPVGSGGTGLTSPGAGGNVLASNGASWVSLPGITENTTYGNFSGGSSALSSNTTGANNFAVGDFALQSNTTGSYNIALGTSAQRRMQSASAANVAIGYNAMSGSGTAASNTGSSNNAVGANVLSSLSSGSANDALGYNALLSTTTGGANVAMGYQAGYYNTTGSSNTAIGYQAEQNMQSSGSNTAVGANAMTGSGTPASNTGSSNVGVGSFAMNAVTSGYYDVGVGANALKSNTTGVSNSAVGHNASYSNTTGGANVAVGDYTLNLNSTGSFNVGAGAYALYNETTDGNTAIGYSALYSDTTGGYNTAIGYQAGYAGVAVTTGANNTFVGSYAGLGSGSAQLSNATAIGSLATVTASNTVAIGRAASDQVAVGATSGQPGYKMVVRGDSTNGSGLYAVASASSGAGIQGVGTGTSTNSWGVVGSATSTAGFASAGAYGTINGAGGATGYLGYFDGTNAWSLYASQNAYVGGNLGVGTSGPQQNLSVQGGINLDQANANSGTIPTSGANSCLTFGSGSGEGVCSQRTTTGGNQFGLDFYTGFIKRMSIANNGNVTIFGTGTTTIQQALAFDVSAPTQGPYSFTVCSSSNGFGTMGTCSSSRRYKKDIRDLELGLDAALTMRPITYKWKDRDAPAEIGFVAEEMHEVAPMLVTYNKQDQIEGVRYERVAAVLVNALKELKAEKDREVERLRGELQSFKERVSRLERLLSAVHQGQPNDQMVGATR
jgi:hypothetical protein